MSQARLQGPSPETPTLPHSIEFERAVLGALLVEGSRLSEVPTLNAAHFYRQPHALIFAAMRSLEEDDLPIDMPILARRLDDRGALENIGGKAYLCGLTDVSGLKSANVEHYAQQLIDLCRARNGVLAVRKFEAEVCQHPQAIYNGALSQCVDVLSRISCEVADDAATNTASDDGPAWPEPPAPAAFHGLVGELVDVIKPHTEADPVALAVNLLEFFGNAAGRAPHFMIGPTRHGANLFSVLVGRSAFGRKGESEKPIRYLFERADPNWAQDCVGGGLSSGEGLLNVVRDKAEVADKRRLFTEGEFSGVLRHAKRDGNTLSQKIRELWDAPERLKNETKGDPMVVTGAHISIVGHITLEELRKELTDVDRYNGFANRFMWFAVQRHGCLPDPQPFDDEFMTPYVDELCRRLDEARRRTRMYRDRAATDLYKSMYHEWGNEWEESAGSIMTFMSRCAPTVVRLSLVYALFDGAPMIRVEHVEAARALWEYSTRSVRFLFGGLSGNEFADRMLRKLRDAGALPKARIYALFGNNADRAKIDRALALLEKMKLAYLERRPTGGRPLEMWRAGASAGVRTT